MRSRGYCFLLTLQSREFSKARVNFIERYRFVLIFSLKKKNYFKGLGYRKTQKENKYHPEICSVLTFICLYFGEGI